MKLLTILSVLFTQFIFAQTINTNISVGNKALELGVYNTSDEDFVIGGSIAISDTDVNMYRANIADIGNYLHKANSKYTPTIFTLIGGKYNKMTFTGKVGVTYLNQLLCKIQDSRQTDGVFIKDNRHLYVSIGMQAIYNITDNFGISASFDNVNAAMFGINFKLN